MKVALPGQLSGCPCKGRRKVRQRVKRAYCEPPSISDPPKVCFNDRRAWSCAGEACLLPSWEPRILPSYDRPGRRPSPREALAARTPGAPDPRDDLAAIEEALGYEEGYLEAAARSGNWRAQAEYAWRKNAFGIALGALATYWILKG